MQKRIAKESKAKAANESKTAPSCCWQQADDEMQMKVREKLKFNFNKNSSKFKTAYARTLTCT